MAHSKAIAALNQQHDNTLSLWNADKKLWADRFSKQEKVHADEVAQLNNFHTATVTKLNSDWEAVRVEKDSIIKVLYAKQEE